MKAFCKGSNERNYQSPHAHYDSAEVRQMLPKLRLVTMSVGTLTYFSHPPCANWYHFLWTPFYRFLQKSLVNETHGCRSWNQSSWGLGTLLSVEEIRDTSWLGGVHKLAENDLERQVTERRPSCIYWETRNSDKDRGRNDAKYWLEGKSLFWRGKMC